MIPTSPHDQDIQAARTSLDALTRKTLTIPVLRAIESEFRSLRKLAESGTPEERTLIANIRSTFTRAILGQISTVDRKDEGLCYAINQTIWFMLLPEVLREMDRNLSVIKPYEAMRASWDVLSVTVFDLHSPKARTLAKRMAAHGEA